MAKERIIPIDRVDNVSERIDIDLSLPDWVRMENVGVNVSRLEFLMNLGGIKELKVKGKSGEVSKSYLTSVGTAPDGSNYAAGLGTSKQKPLANNKLSGEALRGFKNTNWRSASIEMNINEIQSRIQQKGLSLRDGKNWRPFLDVALRDGIKETGVKNLLFLSREQLVDFLFANLASIYIAIAKPEVLPYVLPTNCVIQTGLKSIENFDESFLENGKGEGYRFSIIPGLEVDRAIVLSAAAVGRPILTDMSLRRRGK